VTITTYRAGLRIIVGVFAVAAAAWLFTLGPLGPWHWHEVARLQVPASPPVADYQNITGGPYVTSASFFLSGHDARLDEDSVVLPSQVAQQPLHADVVFEVSRSAVPPARDDYTTPGSAGRLAFEASASGTQRPGGSAFPLFGLPSGRYRLFAYATAKTTLVVRDSRAEKGPALLLLGGLLISLAAWVLLWHFGPRRVLA
jgi:hypothetical protein